MLYVVGRGEENEVMLFSVVLALRDSLAILLKYVSPRLWITSCVLSVPLNALFCQP